MNPQYFVKFLNMLIIAIISPTMSYGGIINFETIPGVGTPTEGLEINTQFLATEGVSFSLEGGGFPVIAKVGSPITAFAGPPSNAGADNSAPNQGIGSFFLTDDGVLGGLSSPALIVAYNSPTAAASGRILDIDFDESFVIQLRDILDNILDTITITAGDSNTGDGIATAWSFDRGVNEVHSIRFKGTRKDAGAFGLGFDNFNARSVPEPSTLAIWLIGVAAIGASRYCSRKRRMQAGIA